MANNVVTYVSVAKEAFPKGTELVPTIEQVDDSKAENAEFMVTITAKEKRYVLPMDGTECLDDTDDTESTRYTSYAYRPPTGVWTTDYYKTDAIAVEDGAYVTQDDIDVAPAWVKAIVPVEVEDL